MRTRFALATVPFLLLGGLLAACSDDDGSGGDEASGCSPVGTELRDEATDTVDVDLTDYAFAPDTVEVEAGVVTFVADNVGEEFHELAFLPGGGEVPFVEPGVPDEDALADAGAFELEGFAPGASCEATWELEPGDFTFFCIVVSEDGETHAEKGMVGTLTVT
jgi:plastocyanin